MYVILAMSCAFAVALADVPTASRTVELPLDFDISRLRAHAQLVMTPNGPVPHPRKMTKPSTGKNSGKSETEVARAPFDDKNVLVSSVQPESADELEMTLEDEVVYLRERLDVVRKDIDQWMNVPHHRNVELPLILGAASGVMVIVVYKLLGFVLTLIMRIRNRRTKSRLTLSGEKKKFLASRKNRKRTGSEDSMGDVTI